MNAQQLRNSILQQAIQGKLVPQDPTDEPASVLLQRIRKEKERLVKEGKLKKKDLESKPIEEDEIPFEIPNGWAFCRLGDLGDYRKGPFGSSLTKSMFVPKSETSVKVYEQKNAIQKDWRLGEYYISSAKYETMKSFTVLPGDIIVSCAGTIGETYYLPNDAVLGIINQALMRVKLFDNQMVLYWQLLFDYVMISNTKMKGNGSAIKNIPPFEILKNIVVPLPPLAEQRRIVAKIEELMPLVERYGKAQQALDQLNESLPARLRQSILQEAIQGRLVPQDPKEEPASELLKRIRKEKEQLVKEGKLKKKDLESKPIEEDEIPFEIPESWEWVRLNNISKTITKGTTPRGGNVAYSSTGIGFLRAENVGGFDELDLSKLKFVTEEEHQGFLSRSIIEADDVLITIAGTLGRTALVKEKHLPLNANQAVSIVRLVNSKLLSLKYLIYSLNEPSIQKVLTKQKKVTAIPNLTLEIISDCIIPLPPLSEQKRIVAKVEELFGVMG